MTIKNSTINQIDKSIEILSSIKGNVTPDDKKLAKSTLDVGDFTISQYLNGKGRNLDTALALIKFFNRRIAQREKVIS